VHPLAVDHVQTGGLVEAKRFDVREALQAGLTAVRDPRAAGWRAGLSRENTAYIGPLGRQYAVHDLLSTQGPIQFQDGQQGNWTFSHDRMMHHGVHRRTGADLGWFGAGGKGDMTPFDSQPAPIPDNRGGSYLVNAHDMYEMDKRSQRLRHVLHVEGREQLGAGIAVFGPRTALLTNRRVVLLQDRAGEPAPLAAIRLPMPFGDLERAEVAQVADGTLVSLIGGYRSLDGYPSGFQAVYLVDAAGTVSELARRQLSHDFPVLFEHKGWWLSPVLHALVNLPDMLIEKGVVPDDGASRFAPLMLARPSPAWMAMIVLALASGVGAAWWTRRAKMSPAARLAWCLGCLLLGLPALLSLMVLQPRAAREVAAAAAPAAA
jgi:hypothetical protein